MYKDIVTDFYKDLEDNESVVNNSSNRALIVVNEDNIVTCMAILYKKKKTTWDYILYYLVTNNSISLKVKPFRATKLNKEVFNKKSNKLAEKLADILENQPKPKQF